MRGDPRITNACSLTVSFKQFDESVIAQRFFPPFPSPANEKDVGAGGICWTFIHYIVTHRLQGLRLQQVHDPLCPRFCSYPFRMLIAIADHNSFASVGDITQLQVEYLPGSESSMQHQQQHGSVTLESQGGQEFADLVIIHRTRDRLYGFDMYRPADGSLPARMTHEGAVAFGDAGQRRIIHLLNGILSRRVGAGENEILVEGGDRSEDAINGGWRQTCGGRPLPCRRREHETETLHLLPAGELTQILQEQQSMGWGKLQIREVLLLEKAHEME